MKLSFGFGGSNSIPAASLASIIWFLCSGGLVHGLAIDAWLVDELQAPQVVMYDDATGSIFYSLCNSSGTPVFPADSSAAFDLKFPPLNGTGVAGFGYWGKDTGVAAQFFYQTDEGAVVDATFYCDADTGHYTPSEKQWVVSAGVENLPTIRKPSIIEVLPVGENAGQRIYFRDEDNQPAVLGYHPDVEKWQFDGYVLQANLSTYSGSIGATILGTRNITIALAINEDLGISRLGESNWALTGLPVPIFANSNNGDGEVLMTNETDTRDFTLSFNKTGAQSWSLDAFDSSSVNLGLAFDFEGALSVFYIGDNGVLHQINQTDEAGDNWNRAEQQGPERWPVADVDSSKFGIANDFGNDKVWIYYMSGESMTQVYQSERGVWELAVALERSNDTSQITASGGDNSTDSSASDDNGGNQGVTRGARIGIGVGISLGVLLLGGIVGGLSWYYRRRNARNNIAELPGSIRGAARSPARPTEEQRSPVEKQGEELFELPLQGHRHEMENTQLNELPQDPVYEMPGDTFLRPQTDST